MDVDRSDLEALIFYAVRRTLARKQRIRIKGARCFRTQDLISPLKGELLLNSCGVYADDDQATGT